MPFDVDITEVKCIRPSRGYNLYVKYNDENVRLKFKNCKLKTDLFEMAPKKYYICVEYDESKYLRWLTDFETKISNEVKKWRPMLNYFRSFYEENNAKIKVPYRLRKFEADIIDKDGYPVPAFELKKGREIDMTIELSNVWSLQEGTAGSLWVLKSAKLLNESIDLNESST